MSVASCPFIGYKNYINLTGILDATYPCVADSLLVLSLNDNNIIGFLPEEISKCSNLTHLYLHGNSLTGTVPAALLELRNLKRLDVSQNLIPNFSFENFQEFNVSNNKLDGEIPYSGSSFGVSSFSGNPGLCGESLSYSCTAAPAPAPAFPVTDHDVAYGNPTRTYIIWTCIYLFNY
ncbi:hypothetical protein ACJIZ3_009910 [Penstemon smallii]|uniref:Uncharacterized protein n=1 Tax=Penstemon smallii TaxID=265156 RepID=A0ABD3TDV5_9LAMI